MATTASKVIQDKILQCQSCMKTYPFNKRLVDHLDKKIECKEFYKANDLTLPVVKDRKSTEFNRSKKMKPNNEEVENLNNPGYDSEQVSVLDVYNRDCNNDDIQGIDDADMDDQFEPKAPVDDELKKKKSKFPIEFKAAAMQKIIEEQKSGENEDQSFKKVSSDINIKESTLKNWWAKKDKILKVFELRQKLETQEPKIFDNTSKETLPAPLIGESEAGANPINEDVASTVTQPIETKISDPSTPANVRNIAFDKFKAEHIESSSTPVGNSKKKIERCRECKGCLAVDCGTCKFCLDKPKFGGANRLRQKCERKVCEVQEEARLQKGVSPRNPRVKTQVDTINECLVPNNQGVMNESAKLETIPHPSASGHSGPRHVDVVSAAAPVQTGEYNPYQEKDVGHVPVDSVEEKTEVANAKMVSVSNGSELSATDIQNIWRPISQQFKPKPFTPKKNHTEDQKSTNAFSSAEQSGNNIANNQSTSTDSAELERALGSIGANMEQAFNEDVQNGSSDGRRQVAENLTPHTEYFHPDSSAAAATLPCPVPQLSNMPPGLEIIPRKSVLKPSSTSTPSVPSEQFPVVSSNHPSLMQNIVTIEKVEKPRQQSSAPWRSGAVSAAPPPPSSIYPPAAAELQHQPQQPQWPGSYPAPAGGQAGVWPPAGAGAGHYYNTYTPPGYYGHYSQGVNIKTEPPADLHRNTSPELEEYNANEYVNNEDLDTVMMNKGTGDIKQEPGAEADRRPVYPGHQVLYPGQEGRVVTMFPPRHQDKLFQVSTQQVELLRSVSSRVVKSEVSHAQAAVMCGEFI